MVVILGGEAVKVKNVDETKVIQVIMVEDDQILCEEAKRAIEKTSDIKLIMQTGDAADAVELIKQYAPDIVVLDLMLGAGGHGDHVLKDIRNLGNSVHQPGIAVFTDNGNKNLYTFYTGFKGVDTYSIKNPTFGGTDIVNIIRRTYEIVQKVGVNMPDGGLVLERARPESHIEKIRRLEDAISARLEKDGMITGRASGKKYLIDLIVLAVQNGGIGVSYKLVENERIVAQRHNTTQMRVSRNVSTAIHRAYDYVTGHTYDSPDTPFLREEKYRTPYSLIGYYCEIFRGALD